MAIYDIYGIGAALVDTEIEVTDTDLERIGFDKGVMTLVDESQQAKILGALKDAMVASRRASGGSGANSIIAAAYFGASTFYSCKVADDDNGHFYLSDLARASVNYHNANGEAKGITGKCLVMITPDAERTMTTFLGISETLAVDDIDVQALSQSRFAYIEGYLVTSATGKPAAVRLRELAEAHNVQTAMSLSDPAIVEHFHAGLSEMIGGGVDILFCNEQEALQFTKTDSLEDAMAGLGKVAKSYAITRGARGALVYDGARHSEVAARPVKAIDTNGAGDMFAGAFLYGLSRGLSYPEAGAFASHAASVVVSQFGPRLKPEQHDEVKAEFPTLHA